MNWQPIETAPKVFEWVMLCVDIGNGPFACVGAWNGSAWELDDDGKSGFVEPTHWMPLPPPPEVK